MRAIGRFVFLTFDGTWLLWAVVIYWSSGPEPSSGAFGLALGGPVFLVGVFMPGIVAIALTAREHGRPGVSALLARVALWRVDIRFYAIALLLVPAIKIAVALLHRALTGTWPPF